MQVQELRGFVADADIDTLAHALSVPRVQVEEVLSAYSQFRRTGVGRWHLRVVGYAFALATDAYPPFRLGP